MQGNYAQFEAQNAEIVALVVEPQARVQALIQAYGFTYPILADADHAVSSAYGVYNLLNDRRATPSVFVVDDDGTITWAYVGQNTSDRPSTQTILNQIP